MEFILNIVPTAQQRPRHARINGRDITYKSRKQKGNERELEAALLLHRPIIPIEGPVELSFVATFPVPASWPAKRKREAVSSRMWHTSKPDLDNLCKQIKDAMTRLSFWNDDRQVAAYGRIEKRYGERGEWLVVVKKLDEADHD